MGGGRVGVVEAFGDGGASGSGPYRLFLFFFFSLFLSFCEGAGRTLGGRTCDGFFFSFRAHLFGTLVSFSPPLGARGRAMLWT